MTTRERRLVWVLALFAAGGLLYVVKTVVIDGLDAARARKDELLGEQSERDRKLDALAKTRAALKVAQQRSLPANPEDALREYPAALDRIARAAGAKGTTVTPKAITDTRSVPQLVLPAVPAAGSPTAAGAGPAAGEKKVPAYARVGYEIKMKKVDVPTVTRFLQGYYALNLLQQITVFDMKRADADADVGARKGTSLAERSDMEVTIVTEAIILDGAEKRSTLVTTPPTVLAVGGGLTHALLQFHPTAAQKLPPPKFVPVLATMGRDYTAMLARDPFHGPLPPPPPLPKEKDTTEVIEVKPPKPSIDRYVKLAGVSRTSDGTATALVRDGITNHYYKIEIRHRAERVESKTRKVYYLESGAKSLDLFVGEFTVKEEDSSTDRTFKILGLDGNDLVLSEIVTIKPDEKKDTNPPKGNGGPPRGTRGGPTKVDPKVSAVEAVAGGLAQPPAAKPAKPVTEERVYVWRAGQSLADLVPVEKEKVGELIKRAATPPATVAEAGPGSDKLSKAD